MTADTPRRVVLAGGSGFLGRALADHLVTGGYDVVVLTRSPQAREGRARELGWDGRTVGPWLGALDGAAAVVNLAGRSVDCRYTPENRREIIDSRVNSVRAIGAAIRQCARPPAAWVQAGSLAIYGDAGDRVCDETAPHGDGFAVEVCERWEGAFADEATPSTRKTLLRIGFALGPGGGALTPLAQLARLGLGGTVGSGKQFISWLHVSDLNTMFRWGIERDGTSGTYNATGPSPVTNAVFMRALRRAVHRPAEPADAGTAGTRRRVLHAHRAVTGPHRPTLRAGALRGAGLRLRPPRPRRDAARRAGVRR
jgi:uncharacterized protein